MVAWLREAGPAAGRVASVCVGAHVTAAAGLLDGHRTTTHRATAERLAAGHPGVAVDPDPVFVRSGRMWTSAGTTSSMDLAPALVAEDHGHQVALEVSRFMVMYLQRPGSQSRFSVPLSQEAGTGTRSDPRELRQWIAEHLDADPSVSAPGARRLLERTSRLTLAVRRARGQVRAGSYRPAYGSSAISRAFLTAAASLRCCCAVTRVTRRLRILPRSEMNFRRRSVSL
ncbi:hypothetical protein GCM10010347_31430 [Streptomyces cirratus]|uniref:DJ-1/PfpI domain-containing protein n=1 Tax=Streptomyces cirratus TaxID=68187 RepID=A0ABQ3EZS0_9ACTN|nr:hypothetical protein GCM10010347_31430 [Streptomyces cirratus]